jgi:Bacterial Ig domain
MDRPCPVTPTLDRPVKRLFLNFVILLAMPFPLSATSRTSADYAVSAETIDPAGGYSSSADYIHDGGVTGLAGQSDGIPYRVVSAYAAQLPNAPVPGADTLSRNQSLSAKVKLSSLLDNDTDPDGGVLTVKSLDTVSLNGGDVYFEDPWVIYEPADGFNGTDTFHYVIQNADGESAVATVTSVVVPAGSEPSLNQVALLLQGQDLLVRFVGVPGFTYVIQWKAALDDPEWNVLSTTAAAASGLFEALDSSRQTRFYRAISQ